MQIDSTVVEGKMWFERSKKRIVGIVNHVKKIAKDDPRRVIHSLKMGLAITLVSSFYSLRPLYDGFGASGMWAVLTVVVVFEFTVGGTISRCLNRGFATILAGGLGIGVKHFANCFGHKGEPAILGIFVFLLAAVSTFIRFMPRIKARYDYGVLIFILTFSLVAISGYEVEEILVLAEQRILTILIGGAICLIVSGLICPVWAGQDFHTLIAKNINKLASFLEGFGETYFKPLGDTGIPVVEYGDKSFLQSHKSILTSKSSEDSLANFARWEPYCHGRFTLRHQCNQYVTIGALVRQCAYQLEALSAYIESDIKVLPEFRRKIQDSCIRMSNEVSRALKALGLAVETRTYPGPEASAHQENSKQAVEAVHEVLGSVSCPALSSHAQDQILAIVPDASVVSLLVSVVDSVEKISEAVNDLARLAHFKAHVETATVFPNQTKQTTQQLLHRGVVEPVSDEDGSTRDDEGDINVDRGASAVVDLEKCAGEKMKSLNSNNCNHQAVQNIAVAC